jgi:hypothetical protein
MTDNLDQVGRILDSAEHAELEARVKAQGEALRLLGDVLWEMNSHIKALENRRPPPGAGLGTSRAEVDAGRSPTVKLWNRSTGELRLRDGTVVFCDGADDGGLRVQGKNLRGCWAEEIGLWRQ